MQTLATAGDAARWLRERTHASLHTDSRVLAAGDAFLAWPGERHDARAHVAQALGAGAAAVIVESSGASPDLFNDARVAAMRGLKAASGPIADAFFNHPSGALRVLAVTGTNGKTSTAWWLAQALGSPTLPTAWPCAMVGTLGVALAPGSALASSGLTTPDAVLLQRSLRDFADHGARACAMEASSIGLAEHRLDGTRLHTAVFTNLTQDHLDYHGDMQAYWQAKQRLFRWPGLQAAVVNIDDPHGAGLADALRGAALDLWTTSCESAARLRATDIRHDAEGLRCVVIEGTAQHVLRTRLIGQYNVSNLLGVIAAMRTLGVELGDAIAACGQLSPVPGRMQCTLQAGKPMTVVDYAHTPDALDKVIAALRPVAAQRGGRLWCVFGCGGDRDPGKRPLMGRAAAAADLVVLTSDNPRSEDPMAILAQIAPGLAGHAGTRQLPDRASAIGTAVHAAAAADVVLVAGKGHESSQEIGNQRLPFSDQEHLLRALASWQTQSVPSTSGVMA